MHYCYCCAISLIMWLTVCNYYCYIIMKTKWSPEISTESCQIILLGSGKTRNDGNGNGNRNGNENGNRNGNGLAQVSSVDNTN